ncbi:hypothetical protein F53441_4985 [Fusarium austroafricanum]|uniref:Uncharacterized protein n=1 Tax=Fusarium austroafricanum TaxID=2364996 RepID=A0A8H4P8S7_9HYPO|nr:hypothetical protein F53441_4985 [Fusarium austroafricanum]
MPSQVASARAARQRAATRRLLRTTPLAANDVWCLHCFRSATALLSTAMAKPEARKPTEVPAISCVFESSSSSRCAHCIKSGGSCDAVYALLSGNAADVTALTNYARRLAALEDDEADPADPVLEGDEYHHAIPPALRYLLVGVVLDL